MQRHLAQLQAEPVSELSERALLLERLRLANNEIDTAHEALLQYRREAVIGGWWCFYFGVWLGGLLAISNMFSSEGLALLFLLAQFGGAWAEMAVKGRRTGTWRSWLDARRLIDTNES
jgi:hypothetical protein